MKTPVIAGRLIRQISGDKRTLAIIIIAPVLIMTLLYYLLAAGISTVYIDAVESSGVDVDMLKDLATVTVVGDEDEAIARLESGDSDGYIYGDKYVAEGTDPGIRGLATKVFTQYSIQQKIEALPSMIAGAASGIAQGIDPVAAEKIAALPSMISGSVMGLLQNVNVETYYGTSDDDQFSFLAPSMMGFVIFFLVFLIAGIAFLRERISGTLERIMATSLCRSQLVGGYFLGFGVFAAVQTIVIQVFMIYVLKIHTGTNFFLVLLINLTIAATSLSMGTLFSAFARNEFQLIQFIPIVIIPQVMFCGLFNLRDTAKVLQWLSKIFPLTYGADALREVMLRGKGFLEIYPDLIMMLGFTALFILLNIRVLRKYREI